MTQTYMDADMVPDAPKPKKDEGMDDLFGEIPVRPQPKHSVPYQKHSETSHEAAEAIKPHVCKMGRQIHNYIVSRGTTGATRKEIESSLNMKTQTVTARLVDLEEAKMIRKLYTLTANKQGQELVKREKCGVYVQYNLHVPSQRVA